MPYSFKNGGIPMFAASTYEEIIEAEKQIENLEIVVFLFVKPTTSEALEIIKEFEYIHYNAADFCSVYAIGYSNDLSKAADREYKKAASILDSDWYFSSKAFVAFKERLGSRIHWQYSGETEVLILQNKPGEKDCLNFQNYVAVNVNKGLREGYIDSFQLFMESLISSSKSQVTARAAIETVRRKRLSIKTVISEAITNSKKIPKPVQGIIKDRLFYRCANHQAHEL